VVNGKSERKKMTSKLKITILFILFTGIVIFPKPIYNHERWILEKYKWCYPKMIVTNKGMYFEEKCEDRIYFKEKEE